MILFHSENDFTLENEKGIKSWLSASIKEMKREEGDLNYIFCDDDYLLAINKEYLKHDTFTDIISFDYSIENKLSGDIYISTQRVLVNATTFENTFYQELTRVLIHGILHFARYDDKTDEERKEMRKQEDYYLTLRRFC